jgi:hypothetical protein
MKVGDFLFEGRLKGWDFIFRLLTLVLSSIEEEEEEEEAPAASQAKHTPLSSVNGPAAEFIGANNCVFQHAPKC